MLYSSERVTVESMESYLFILVLLFFAFIATSFVLRKGLEDYYKDRENYNIEKLILRCILILTSVVPPELPVELAMAVNAAL